MGGGSGYDWMRQTYTTHNDGWSWHDYWRSGVEFWQDLLCQDPDIVSDHLFQSFPDWLQSAITSSPKPAFITEADLLSPCKGFANNILNKDASANTAQESIWRFVQQERGGDYVVVWLVTNQYADPPIPGGQNVDCSGNGEIAWHEAYRDNPVSGIYERNWFPLWWLRAE